MTVYNLKGTRRFSKLLCARMYKSNKEVYPPYTVSGAPVDGVSGTHAGVAEPGALLIRTDSASLYQNTNTKASPTWTLFSLTSGAGDFTGTFNGIIGGVTPAAATVTTLVGSGTTDASSSTTGALKTAGGLGVAKKAYIGTDLLVGGLFNMSAADTITAHSGGGQGSATALTKGLNRVTVSGADTDSVVLPAATAGRVMAVFNDDSAQDIAIFPATGETIDGLSANAKVDLGQGKRALFFCFTAGAWISAQLGVVSAA